MTRGQQSLKFCVNHLLFRSLHQIVEAFRQVLLDVRAGNSNFAKSFSEKSNHTMYQDENPLRGLLSLQNFQS